MNSEDVAKIVGMALSMQRYDDRIWTEELMLEMWDDGTVERQESEREIEVMQAKIDMIAEQLKDFLK